MFGKLDPRDFTVGVQEHKLAFFLTIEDRKKAELAAGKIHLKKQNGVEDWNIEAKGKGAVLTMTTVLSKAKVSEVTQKFEQMMS